jgi:YidC/Oxa1 family membrane protein insertase
VPLALVVGAGFGGLAAAIRLSAMGYRVQVLYAWGDPIGKAGVMAGQPAWSGDAIETAAEQELQAGAHHDGMHFFPLSAASYRSMAKMKLVTPKMTAIRERHKGDPQQMNAAMMELYKTEKINPLGGCLPVVVQIPVFIALYWVLLASVEMRHAPWLGWIQDLAAPDPWYILPVIMAVSMFVQTKLNPTPPDPIQAKVMMFMPIAFSVMFFFFPSGLVLYWVVNNLLSIAQQWVITQKAEKTK